MPFIHPDSSSVWDEEDEIAIWEATADLLEDDRVPKILQNYLYDAFVMAWSYGILIRGLQDDTMLKHFELYPELEKGLGFQASIYTKEPFYKAERKSTDERTQLIYCGKDACVTFECNEVMDKMLKPQQRQHYEFNLSLLAPLLYMEARGIRYDHALARERLAETQTRIYELQDQINREAARSPERPALRQFYEALGICMGEGGTGIGLQGGGTSERVVTNPTKALIPLLASAFCCCERDRRERREVEEVSWQILRWNPKSRKWVKEGCRQDAEQVAAILVGRPHYHKQEEAPEPREGHRWLKPHRKLVSKLVPVEVATLEDVRRFRLGSKEAECKRGLALVSRIAEGGASPAQRGELATLLGVGVKLNATGRGKDKQAEDGSTVRGSERDANWLLYEWWKLPKQFKKDGVRLTDKLSSDAESVIKAYLKSGKDDATRDQRALTFLKWRWHDTQRETLEAECDADGRIRCGYNLVGTETHRLSCYESPTGSGFNLQTVTKGLRDLFLADEGCVLCQRDLSGADGWTVAAYAALLGDRTMLEDYRAKLKPAQIIVLMLDQGAGVNRLSRDELRPLCKPITEEADWRYFAMKRVQHGSSYMMGKGTTSDQILTDSFKKDGKPVFLAPKDCERIQQTCFFVRYPGIKRLHEWMIRELKEKGVLTASNGFSRRFFGRKDDAATQRQALAHLPQVYTTYATTLALSQLWKDPTNRREDGSLLVEPLHTVHDSLLTQWHEEDTPYAKEGIVRWFANEMRIAGELITIPASGTYGRSWGEQQEQL